MSGGHWEYKQWALSELCDGIRRDLARAGKLNEWGDQYPDDPRLLAGLRLAVVMVEATDQLVHDLDWCLSGDTDPDTLEENLAQWRKRFAPRLRRALFPGTGTEAKSTRAKKPPETSARRSKR
jgi:hypothetical protein